MQQLVRHLRVPYRRREHSSATGPFASVSAKLDPLTFAYLDRDDGPSFRRPTTNCPLWTAKETTPDETFPIRTRAWRWPHPRRVAAAGDGPDPVKLAATIDARLAAGWDRAKVRPALVVDDTTFLRRASLDLIGRIATVAETRDFLADKAPDKRAKLVNRLVDSGGHSRHMATYWRKTWVPQTNARVRTGSRRL